MSSTSSTTPINMSAVQVPTLVETEHVGNRRPLSAASMGSGTSWNGGGNIRYEGDQEDDDQEEQVDRDDDNDDDDNDNDDDDDFGDDSTRGPSPGPFVTSSAGRSRRRHHRHHHHHHHHHHQHQQQQPHNLQVPSEHYGLFGTGRKSVAARLSETLFEEESDLIRSCGALSAVLGVRKSFSTSDISQSATAYGSSSDDPLKTSSSELALYGGDGYLGNMLFAGDLALDNRMMTLRGIGMGIGGVGGGGGGCLDYASRSCSTWVAVGDMASTSQLPSPQGNPPATAGCQFSDSPPVALAAEFIRSVNKKVRQTYIKRRLLTTYKALERIVQSELSQQQQVGNNESGMKASGNGSAETTATVMSPWAALVGQKVSKTHVSREIVRLLRRDLDPRAPALQLMAPAVAAAAAVNNCSLTANDVDNEKGKPLSKFERNMIIFDWLHTLGNAAGGSAGAGIDNNSCDRLA